MSCLQLSLDFCTHTASSHGNRNIKNVSMQNFNLLLLLNARKEEDFIYLSRLLQGVIGLTIQQKDRSIESTGEKTLKNFGTS